MKITSTKNEQIKHLKLLQSKSKLRLKENCFVVEGQRELEMAILCGYDVLKVFVNQKIASDTLDLKHDTQVVEISETVYQHIAYRSGTEGIIGICKAPKHDITHLELTTKNPLILVLESPEKPGNIGAILRTADAAKVDAVVIAEPLTDLYNPNTIRSSLGAIFSNTIATGSNQDVYDFLSRHHIRLFSATLQNSNDYLKEDYTQPTAFIMGSEAQGLTNFWRDKANIQAVNIPMKGKLDSLNLSVSTAILTFEALRQRS